jgi:SlyX protein
MDTVDRRITDLELRYMGLEKLTHELSDVVAAQGRLIDSMRAELAAQAQRLLTRAAGDDGDRNTLLDERPPHY